MANKSKSKTPGQLDREIKAALAAPAAPTVSDFTVRVGNLGYRVSTGIDFDRGGYRARLIAEGIGTVMDENGASPSDALTRLARGLHDNGDATDRKIAQEIARHAWFPLRFGDRGRIGDRGLAKSTSGSSDADHLFIGTMATGISYADRSREAHGDYLRLAFLPFRTLSLEWKRGVRVSPGMRQLIVADAERLAARRGEDYPIDSAGHTVRLGG